MKTRSFAVWTMEDTSIWGHVVNRVSARMGVDAVDVLHRNFIKCDRSDAYLMLELEQLRKHPLKPAARYEIPVEFQEHNALVMLNQWTPPGWWRRPS